jgi:hypothetical protein
MTIWLKQKRQYLLLSIGANNAPGISRIAVVASALTTATKINIDNWTELEDPQNIFNPITGVYSTPFNISNANAQSYDYQITMSYELNLVNTSGGILYGSASGVANNVFYKPMLGVSAGAQTIIFSNLYTNTTPPSGSNIANNAVPAPLTIPNGVTTILSQTAQTTLPLTYPQLNQLSSGTLRLGVANVSPPLVGQATPQVYWRSGGTGGTNSAAVVNTGCNYIHTNKHST